MLTLAHAWSRKQKWLIVASAALGLAALGAMNYGYQRYYRGPGEEAFYGTWEATDFLDHTVYFRFEPDQTFAIGNTFQGEFSPFIAGRWYAGGSFLYLRFSAEDMGPSRPWLFRIVDIQQHELHLRLWRQLYIFRRATIDTRNASNHARQRTAGAARSRFR